MIQAIRTLRPSVALGIRQYVSSAEEELSKKMIRPIAVIFLLTFCLVLIASQFFSWRIGHEGATMEKLRSIRSEVGSENISLLASRASLMSPDHIEAVAAVRLGLYRPGASQQHRL